MQEATRLIRNVPRKVHASSVWYPYFHSLFGTSSTIDSSNIRFLYLNDHIPVQQCMTYERPPWPYWPTRMVYDRKNVSSICDTWYLKKTTNDDYEAIEPIFSHKKMIAIRWWSVADRKIFHDFSWVEVFRQFNVHETKTGVGTWFVHAPGSGIFVNIGRSYKLKLKTFKNTHLYRQWLTYKNMSALEADTYISNKYPEFKKWWWKTDAFTVMAKELGYDSVQIMNSQSQRFFNTEIVLLSENSTQFRRYNASVPCHVTRSTMYLQCI